jgi:Zn-dependent peptidase ImmA (M78 family)
MTFGELIPIAISNGSMTPGRLKALNEEVHGLCIPWKAGRAIVHNDSRSPQRQQSDVAHEVAHVLLAHPISELHVNTGATMRNNEHEKEAVWLGGVLLVPKPAAIRGLRSGLSNAAAAKFYGISEQLWTWRCNASGASLIARRRAAAPA